MSEIKTNKISPSVGTTLTLGDSGDTITTAGTVSGFGLFSGYAIFADQKAAGTAGGTATAGAWTQRDINTTLYNGDTSNIALGKEERGRIHLHFKLVIIG
jgi:hypothetical protein